MGKAGFAQPPTSEKEVKDWRKAIHELLVGGEHSGGKLSDENMAEALLTVEAVKTALSMTDPEDADGTLADITTKFNNLLTELRTVGLL